MSAPHVIAVDLGGTKLAVGLVDRAGAVVRRAVEPTELSSEETVLAQLERVIGGLAENGFAALGVGVPSTIDQRSGRAVTSVNIPLAGVDLRDRLGGRFGVPVAIENDGNAAAGRQGSRERHAPPARRRPGRTRAPPGARGPDRRPGTGGR